MRVCIMYVYPCRLSAKRHVHLFLEVSVRAPYSIFNLQLCACHLAAQLH